MAKKTANRVAGTPENWESGLLGNSEKFAKVVDGVTSKEFDAKLGLKPISIRLQESMIEDLKLIAKVNGLSGYQPLIRRVLTRFVEAEMKIIARDLADQARKSEEAEIDVHHEMEPKVAAG